MENKRKTLSTLLASISGVLIFLSLSHYVDLNGLTKYSFIFIVVGVSMLFWSSLYLKNTPSWITKPIVMTISHILIFIGVKVYLGRYLDSFWVYIFNSWNSIIKQP